MENVLTEKTIKKRYSILQEYLKNNEIGILNKKDSITFKHIFQKFYTPDDGEIKFNIDDICCISVVRNKYAKKCFNIIVDDIRYHTSIKRLSGSVVNKNLNLTRAMRFLIEDQIMDYIKMNPLDQNMLCPITGYKLGYDSQVDHIIPFHKIAKKWLSKNDNVSVKYDINKFNYIIEDINLSNSWKNYHLVNSELRWLSRDGNKVAHLFYTET